MNKKVLIIDDEADIRFLLERGLTSNNYQVKVAENLVQGIDKFNHITPDIIVLDVNLPDGNGSQETHSFRKKSFKTSIILISADSDHLIDNYKLVGADAFIKKPFSVNQLIAVINTLQ
jgi:DNA-binding response OmpR family regulator